MRVKACVLIEASPGASRAVAAEAEKIDVLRGTITDVVIDWVLAGARSERASASLF